MIPYELIVPSASRPHLLRPALTELLSCVTLLPVRIWVHDDAVFPSRQDEVADVLSALGRETGLPVNWGFDAPPIGHGPALHWLLSHATTEYVLYSQDDLRPVRPLPVRDALSVMAEHGLHYVGFNKRATMGSKGGWVKRECHFGPHTLTLSPHWNFQTGLWRRGRIARVVAWWMGQYSDQALRALAAESFREHCEAKINRAFNGQIPGCAEVIGLDVPSPDAAMDQDVRIAVQRTFLWGPIGEDRYIENLGADPADWALRRPRGGATVGPGADKDSQVGERDAS